MTRPSRRQAPSRFVVDSGPAEDTAEASAKNSPRKNPNGTKTAMFESVSTGPCPLFRNMREKSSVRSCPAACFMIPQYRIPTAVSSRNRPMKTVSPKAIAPYTEHFFRIRRMTVNANDTTPITAQCVHGTWERMPRAYVCNADPVIIRAVVNKSLYAVNYMSIIVVLSSQYTFTNISCNHVKTHF